MIAIGTIVNGIEIKRIKRSRPRGEVKIGDQWYEVNFVPFDPEDGLGEGTVSFDLGPAFVQDSPTVVIPRDMMLDVNFDDLPKNSVHIGIDWAEPPMEPGQDHDIP